MRFLYLNLSRIALFVNIKLDFFLAMRYYFCIIQMKGGATLYFYEILQSIMVEKGLKIPDVARLTGLTDSTIRSIISRKNKTVALEVAFKISRGLDIPIERLNGESIDPTLIENNKAQTLGDILKKYRQTNGLSMDEFAKISGLSKGYISMLENNINPRNNKPIAPTIPTLKKIATGIGTDIDTLLKTIDSAQETALSQEDDFFNQSFNFVKANEDCDDVPSITNNTSAEKVLSNLGNKEIMAKNIQYYMDKYEKTRQDMCEALGVKYTTFTDWVKGNSYPRIDKIELMANYFGISKADLVEEHLLDGTPSNELKEIIKKYRFICKYSADGEQILKTIIDREYQMALKIKEMEDRIKELEKTNTPTSGHEQSSDNHKQSFEDYVNAQMDNTLIDLSVEPSQEMKEKLKHHIYQFEKTRSKK